MNCPDLEHRLEDLLESSLSETELEACERHLEACEGCRDLVQLARLAEARPGNLESTASLGGEPPDLVAGVLARTSGGACERAREVLAETPGRRPEGTDGELLAGHLGACEECASLDGVLATLRIDLPRLAVLRTDQGFVADVLGRTLPVNVQLRRWWGRTWPNLVRRPRFASEAAFVALIALVVVFATPGSPLEAVPARALAIAQDPPIRQVELPAVELPSAELQERLDATARALRESKGGQVAADWQAAGEQAADRAAAFIDRTGERLGTFWDEAASLLGRTDGETSSEPETTIEETS